MNPSQPQPAEEQILLTVADQSKLDLVRAERVKAALAAPFAPVEPTGSEADFWALAGIRKDRDVDAQRLCQ